MAIKISPGAQAAFFESLYGVNHTTCIKVYDLISKGVSFEISLFIVKAKWNGKVANFELKMGSTSFMKKAVPAPIVASTCKLLSEWIDKVGGMVYGLSQAQATLPQDQDNANKEALGLKTYTLELSTVPGSDTIAIIKAVRDIAVNLPLYDVKKLVEASKTCSQKIKTYSEADFVQASSDTLTLAKVGASPKLVSLTSAGGSSSVADITAFVLYGVLVPDDKPTAPKYVPPTSGEVVSLRDAVAIGQKVKGSSAGSIYYCVAISPLIKIAARIHNSHNTLSLRAEWVSPNTAQKLALAMSGMSMKVYYGSMHLAIGDISPARVIGAYLMGLGIQWDAQVMHAGQLVME